MAANAWSCRSILVALVGAFAVACAGAAETADAAGADLTSSDAAPDIRMEHAVWIEDQYVSYLAVHTPGGSLHEADTVTLGATALELNAWLAKASHPGRSEPWNHVSSVTVNLTFCLDGFTRDSSGASVCRDLERKESLSAPIDDDGGFKTPPFKLLRHYQFMLVSVIFDGDERSPVTRHFRLDPPTTIPTTDDP